MRVNVKTLNEVLKSLQTPKFEGEVTKAALMSRLDEFDIADDDKGELCTKTERTITLIAARYCNEDGCWLEWELDL